MKVIEILKMSRTSLELLQRSCISMRDLRFIDLYEDYERMAAEGEKITYLVSVLAEKYHISERQVYYIIRKFGCDCNFRAV